MMLTSMCKVTCTCGILSPPQHDCRCTDATVQGQPLKFLLSRAELAAPEPNSSTSATPLSVRSGLRGLGFS